VFGITEENIKTLIQLGLTSAQAKVYLTLATLEKATAKEISNHSDVAREEVYRLLAALQKKGLIEQIIASPTQFKAFPIEEGLSILIRRKEKEISGIKKKISRIRQNFQRNNAKTMMNENETQFALIPEKDAFILRLKKMVQNDKKTIDAICEGRGFARSMFEIDEEVKECLRRGVRIRVIVANSEEEQSWRKAVQEYVKCSNYKIKTLTIEKGFSVGIHDGKEMNIICFSEKDFAESPFLWSDNANIVKMAQDYFESMWSKASEYVFRTASSKQKAST
jgi:sugar-specific transcriptional regulator TrmB